jgi:hypothetical protein
MDTVGKLETNYLFFTNLVHIHLASHIELKMDTVGKLETNHLLFTYLAHIHT